MEKNNQCEPLRGLGHLSQNELNKLAGVALLMRGARWKNKEVARVLGVRDTQISKWLNHGRPERAAYFAGQVLSRNADQGTGSCLIAVEPVAYLSGAITGRDPAVVAEEFGAGAKRLSAIGFEVINPLDNGLPLDAEWTHHMRADIARMMQCNAIYVVGDIRHSKGAKVELDLARSLEYKVMSYRDSDEKLKEVLDSYEKRR